jgi:hypothetical protein
VNGSDFTVLINDPRELKMRLEAGHRVEYRYNGAYVISQKRGKEYVTASGIDEADARRAWDKAHEDGYHYDWKTNQRITIPGAR